LDTGLVTWVHSKEYLEEQLNREKQWKMLLLVREEGDSHHDEKKTINCDELPIYCHPAPFGQ
jgi:hypothetical protein